MKVIAMNIRHSVVFVTGANRGLGLALAREARDRGAKVYAGMRHTAGFDEPGLIPVTIDVTDHASVKDAAERADDVTVLVNNAGTAEILPDPLADDYIDMSLRLIDLNYHGVVRATQAFAPHLPADGAIVNVLSDVTWKPVLPLAPYAGSKAAAWTYTNHVRQALKARRIQVLALHVGFVDTDLTRGLDVPKTSPQDVARRTFDALQAGKSEIMADAGTAKLKGLLSAEHPAYIDPAILD
jgi:NAD(P)-dependent dehydrogenase (short-subunit alcohol dehydrogenase family)